MQRLIKDRRIGYISIRAKKITRAREWHVYMIKRSIYHEDTAILNAYEPNRATKYVKQKLTEQ